MEAAIRFSQNSSPLGSNPDQRFLHVDVANKSFRLCTITSRPTKTTLTYSPVATSGPKVPAFRAFDWHPTLENLVVVGQAGGEATLLNLNSVDSQSGSKEAASSKTEKSSTGVESISFNVRSQRPSNAVALSSQHLLAAGLDRVRTDFCLNIWDFTHRLPSTSGSSNAFPFTKAATSSTPEPLHKLAPGEPITSLKFFPASPSLLVAGVKGQFVRIYDLRDPLSASSGSSPTTPPDTSLPTNASSTVGGGLQFPTRCVHNLAIDTLDTNYFASCLPTPAESTICIWDRRMGARAVISSSSSFNSVSSPSSSLDLKPSIGAIWSLRFAKSRRGCLGVLSNTGHIRVYETGKDFEGQGQNGKTYHVDATEAKQDKDAAQPQDIHLSRAHDITVPSPSQSADQIVSFDFTTSTTKEKQPEILTLSLSGTLKTTSPLPIPEPVSISSTGFFAKGKKWYIQESEGSAHSGTEGEADKDATQARETTVLPNLLSLTSLPRHRCRAGYLLSPLTNRKLVPESRPLQALWTWLDRAQRIARGNRMVYDNLDLAYLGVFNLWMEELSDSSINIRTLGSSSATLGNKRMSKAVEGLVRSLSLPVNRGTHTEYKLSRQLCLHTSGFSWSAGELESWTKRLVQQGQHSKAAFVALVAGERTLVHKVLKDKDAGQKERMLGVAIAGATRRAKKRTTPTQSRRAQDSSDSENDVVDDDNAWSSTIASLLTDLTDSYATAILAYVKSNDWEDVLKEETLPLKYRCCVALRHLDDSKLTKYISEATKSAIREGDIEGIMLTGTGTKESFDLMEKYVSQTGDLQSAVLALATTIPRYVNEESVVRKFEAWKQGYRGMMNSWGCRIERVRFNVAVQKVAVENGTGRRLIKPAKPQVKLVCSYCASSVAHHEAEKDEGGQESGNKMHDSARNPLAPATAAAMGTVCPKCGRKLPRCGVCDMWLGVEDESYLKWYGAQKRGTDSVGSVDLSGSVHTIIGPGQTGEKRRTDSPATGGTMAGSKKGSTGSSDAKAKLNDVKLSSIDENAVDTEAVADGPAEKAKKMDEMMARFTVFCVKCSHAFHAAHARMWFQGSPADGRHGHSVCPVPRCSCVCYE